MTRFLSKELYNEMDDLIERVDDLRDVLVDARNATNYEDFDNCMDTAYECAGSIRYDIDELRYEGNELHSNEEDEDEEEEEDDEYQQNFVNALNNFIKAHR